MKINYINGILLFSGIMSLATSYAQNNNEENLINVAFDKQEKEQIVTAVSSIKPDERITYDNTQWIRDAIEGILLGVRGSDDIRGLGGALFVIDGIPGRDVNQLAAEEIEEITVLKDLNALTLYGSQAKNGVIIITTKRGKSNENKVQVSAQYGIKTPIMMPKFLGAAEYMELYNEARKNDGLDPLYLNSDIEMTRSGINPYKYPDVDFYSSDYLKSFTDYENIVAEFTGGTDKVQYYVNLDYKRDGTLEKLNPSINKGTNRFKVRGNVDFKVNDWIKSSVDVLAIINNEKSAYTRAYDAGLTFRPNLYSPLLPVSMIDPSLDSQLSSINQFDGYVLGGSNAYKGIVPIGDIYGKGYQKNVYRTTQVGNTIDFDLSMITPGLTAKTYLSLDMYDSYRVSVNNQFNYYEPEWDGDVIIGLTPLGAADKKDLTETVNTTGYSLRYGFSGQLNYKRKINDHTINAILLGYGNVTQYNAVKQYDKHSHLALSLGYGYKDKLFANFSTSYTHSIKLPQNNRNGFSPSGAVSYILTNEDFLKGNEYLNFLKLRASGGILKSDLGIEDYFLYQEVYNINGGSFGWNDGQANNNQTVSVRGGNNSLGFEERKEVAFGFESLWFKSLGLEMNFFQTDMDRMVTQTSTLFPSFYLPFMPYLNFNKNRYKGFEIALNYKKQWNDFSFNMGTNLLYSTSEILKIDEIQEYDYLRKTGKTVNSIFALEADGFYGVDDFNEDGSLKEGLPVPQFGAVQPGDIKYKNQNDDAYIDDKDQKMIGRWDNPLSYSMNLNFKYKNFSLFVLLNGQAGGQQMLSNNYYWVDGDDKYSEIVRGRWTEETAETATFPRLSSQGNSNNFRNSTFWLYDNSFFQIKRAQLTYEFDERICKRIGLKKLSINISGSNLIEFSKNRKYRQINLELEPQYRYFSIGLRTTI